MDMKMLRLAAFVGVLFAYQFGEGNGVQARTETCLQACTASTDCNEECEVPYESGWIFTVCGLYENGSAGGYCDHSTWDTCNYTCSFSGDDETGCYADGQLTDCGTYGQYLNVNDGICSDAENCLNSNDCGPCPTTPAPTGTGTVVNPYLGSSSTLDTACSIAQSNGFATGWSCPDDGWDDTPPVQWMLCSEKYDRIANVNRAIGIIQSLLQDSQFDAGDLYYLLGMAVTYLNTLTSTPCLLYE